MERDTVYRRCSNNWHEDEGAIIVRMNNELVALNLTAGIVWKMIDGITSVGTMLEQLIEKYGEVHGVEQLQELLKESVELLLDRKMIEKR